MSAQIEEAWWGFLEEEDLLEAIETAVRWAASANRDTDWTEDDFRNEAYLYVATHKETIDKCRTSYIVIAHVKSRLIEKGLRTWKHWRKEDHMANEDCFYGKSSEED